MLKVLFVGAGGFVGAVARYWLSGLAHGCFSTRFPVGTLLVNVLGCLLIGALMSVVEDRQGLSPNARLFLVIEIVDRAEEIAAFLPGLDAMVGEGMITLENVHIIAYRHGRAEPAGAG